MYTKQTVSAYARKDANTFCLHISYRNSDPISVLSTETYTGREKTGHKLDVYETVNEKEGSTLAKFFLPFPQKVPGDQNLQPHHI